MSVFSKVYENIAQELEQKGIDNNNRSTNFLTSMFYSTVISSFTHEGDIPEFIKKLPSYIEECFFMSSLVAYFEDEGKSYITPCYPSGVLLDNGLYSEYICIFRNGKTRIKKIEDIEICYNCSLGLPSRVIVDDILKKCINALDTVDISLERASTPAITFATDDNISNLIVGAIKKAADKNDPMALVSASSFKGDTLHKYNLFDNREQDVLALWDVFVRYKNLFFSTFGINNVEISKSERLTRAEGESNTEIIRYTLFFDMYRHRVDWYERIKNHFNVNITCSINRNYETVSAMTMSNEEKRKMSDMIIAPYLASMEQGKPEEKEEEENDGD